MKLRFSGHESFICKQFWLPKGVDFIRNEKSFNADDSVVDLGVGKNMVSSIRFWLRAFGLVNQDDQEEGISSRLFGDGGFDPYIEKSGSVWLLHYLLNKTNYASIYYLFFNEFQIGRPQFTIEQLKRFLVRKCQEDEVKPNENTINKDILVLLRSYLKPKAGKKSDLEEEFSRLLIDLNLIRSEVVPNVEGKRIEWFLIDKEERPELPWQIVLFVILDRMGEGERTISFQEIFQSPLAPGLIFGLSREGLLKKIDEICDAFPGVVFSRTAGNEVLQFEKWIDKFEVLEVYYGA